MSTVGLFCSISALYTFFVLYIMMNFNIIYMYYVVDKINFCARKARKISNMQRKCFHFQTGLCICVRIGKIGIRTKFQVIRYDIISDILADLISQFCYIVSDIRTDLISLVLNRNGIGPKQEPMWNRSGTEAEPKWNQS